MLCAASTGESIRSSFTGGHFTRVVRSEAFSHASRRAGYLLPLDASTDCGVSIGRNFDENTLRSPASSSRISVPPTLLATADEVIEWAAICCTAYVGFWHKADILRRPLFVRFRAQSGHGRSYGVAYHSANRTCGRFDANLLLAAQGIFRFSSSPSVPILLLTLTSGVDVCPCAQFA